MTCCPSHILLLYMVRVITNVSSRLFIQTFLLRRIRTYLCTILMGPTVIYHFCSRNCWYVFSSTLSMNSYGFLCLSWFLKGCVRTCWRLSTSLHYQSGFLAWMDYSFLCFMEVSVFRHKGHSKPHTCFRGQHFLWQAFDFCTNMK